MKESFTLLLLVLFVLMLAWHGIASSEPMFVAQQGDVTVTLHGEDCKLKNVSNLKKRATWEQGGKTIEGCYGAMQVFGMVFFYFEDKTVLGIPIPFFEKVSGA